MFVIFFKVGAQPSHPSIIEDDPSYVPSKGWAEIIRKVYEADPLLCPSCGGIMSIISFIEVPKTIDRIIFRGRSIRYHPTPEAVLKRINLLACRVFIDYCGIY